MLGKLSLTQNQHLTVHTYTAPDDGWRANSHIIELPSQLLVVDAQYMLPYAREVVSYANNSPNPSLGSTSRTITPTIFLARPLSRRQSTPSPRSKPKSRQSATVSPLRSARNMETPFPPTPSVQTMSSCRASKPSTEYPSPLSASPTPRPKMH